MITTTVKKLVELGIMQETTNVARNLFGLTFLDNSARSEYN